MPYRPFDGQNCSIAGSLAILGERWTLLVMREVLLGRRRFADIRRNVERRLYAERPESYEYVPTPKGLDVNPVLAALLEWGDRHAVPPGGPPRVLVHTSCGHDAQPRLQCAHCGEAIEARDLAVRPGPGADEQQRAEPLLPALSGST
jgi:DNA-binding HxlR family transcriptional regulator